MTFMFLLKSVQGPDYDKEQLILFHQNFNTTDGSIYKNIVDFKNEGVRFLMGKHILPSTFLDAKISQNSTNK